MRSVRVVRGTQLWVALVGLLALHCTTRFASAADDKRPTNRLAKEKSPYLLQHAHNPVDWYPWGQEAFDKAKKENKPILLSIGYSTCHWCHVMERESFENAEVAKLMNDAFVCIKVDREERPDVDRIYMEFVTATTGSGGWPLTVFLTPDRKPFFGGTYFPAEDKDGLPGMKAIVPKIRQAWDQQNDKIVELATKAAEAIAQEAAVSADAKAAVDQRAMTRAYGRLKLSFDAKDGGFGDAPKFPQPAVLDFLMHYQRRANDPKALDMVLKTLRSMAAGGMHDHLGGGFHRYSTDARWFLPHFEKMLYDQAQLASIYLDAFQVTGDAFFADVARDTLDYVLRDLTGPDGQFYSAEDADSAADPAKPAEKREGAFYVWTAAEIEAALGKDVAAVFNARYGVKANGNVDRDPRNEFTGHNVLSIAATIDEVATQTGRKKDEVEKTLRDAREKLLAIRAKRPRPHLDDKALVAWNGLMISPMARAGLILKEPRYTAAAARAADFVAHKLIEPKSGRLLRHWRDGAANISGFLSDYAFFEQGLIDLYQSTLDIDRLKLATKLAAKRDDLFWDKAGAGYFTTAGDDPHLLMRAKEDSDGAEPSGNSVAALNGLRLSQMLDDKTLRDRARATISAYAGKIEKYPTALPVMLVAVDFDLDKPKQIVIAGKPGAADTLAMLHEVHARYLPGKVVLGADGGPGQAFLAERAAFLKDVTMIDGRATAYVCENFVCQLPTNQVAQLVRLLESRRATPPPER